jgi:hypothetical protein
MNLRYTLILSVHLRPGLWNLFLFHLGFQTKILYENLYFPYILHATVSHRGGRKCCTPADSRLLYSIRSYSKNIFKKTNFYNCAEFVKWFCEAWNTLKFALSTLTGQVKSKSKLYYDRLSVGQAVLMTGTHLKPTTNLSPSIKHQNNPKTSIKSTAHHN